MIYFTFLFIAFSCSVVYDRQYSYGQLSNGNCRASGLSFFWFYVLLIALIIIGGLRDVTMGADTKNYLRYFGTIPEFHNITKEYLEQSDYQPLFNYYFSILKSLFHDFNYVLFVHAIIVNSIILWFIKKYSQGLVFICISLYLSINFLEFNMEIMRESLAVCCGLIAYYFYDKRKLLISLFSAVVAFGFHLSAVVLIFLPLLKRVKYSRKTVSIFIIVSISLLSIFPFISTYINQLQLLLMSYSQTMSEQIETYNNSTIDPSLNIYYFIALFFKNVLFPLVGIVLLKEKVNSIIGFIIAYYFLMIISAYSYAFYRFANYLAVFNIIFLGNYCYAIIRELRLSDFTKACLVCCYIVLILYLFQGNLLGKDTSDYNYLHERYFPYKFCFEE